jgi:hypothetical protein
MVPYAERPKSAAGGYGLEKTANRFPARPLHFVVMRHLG